MLCAEPPRASAIEPHQTVIKGDSIRLRCDFSGDRNRDSKVSWTLPNNSTVSLFEFEPLVVQQVTVADAGVYICEVRNDEIVDVGQRVHADKIFLTVQSKLFVFVVFIEFPKALIALGEAECEWMKAISQGGRNEDEKHSVKS